MIIYLYSEPIARIVYGLLKGWNANKTLVKNLRIKKSNMSNYLSLLKPYIKKQKSGRTTILNFDKDRFLQDIFLDANYPFSFRNELKLGGSWLRGPEAEQEAEKIGVEIYKNCQKSIHELFVWFFLDQGKWLSNYISEVLAEPVKPERFKDLDHAVGMFFTFIGMLGDYGFSKSKQVKIFLNQLEKCLTDKEVLNLCSKLFSEPPSYICRDIKMLKNFDTLSPEQKKFLREWFERMCRFKGIKS